MSDQQRVRDALRKLFPDLLAASLEERVARGQERAAAESIAAELMAGAYDGEKFARFADDRDFIRRPSTPADWKPEIVDVIAGVAEERLVKESPPASKHHTGPGLRRIVAAQVDYDWDAIRRRFDERSETRQSDWFARNEGIRRAALLRLADQLRKACIADVAGPAADERPLKARLKALTILIDERIPPDARAATLRALADPSTRSLPYVARYFFPDQLPALAALPKEDALDLGGFSGDLVRCCPEAELIRDAVERFDRKEGLFGKFADVDAPPRAEHTEQFAKLPAFLPDASSSLLVPKTEALPRHRAHRYRIPDGVVAALGLSILLEWTLRQGTLAAGAGAHEKARAADLTKRLLDKGVITAATSDLLKPVFDCPTLSLRDAIAHGAFFGDDPQQMHRVLGGVARALGALVQDLGRSTPNAFTIARWDQSAALDAKHTALAAAQLKVGLVIFDQVGDADRDHLFAVLRELTPDKRLLGQASFLFFADSYRALSSRKEHARRGLLASCLGAMITLEDLFRAVLERIGERVLRIEATNRREMPTRDPGREPGEPACARGHDGRAGRQRDYVRGRRFRCLASLP